MTTAQMLTFLIMPAGGVVIALVGLYIVRRNTARFDRKYGRDPQLPPVQ